MLRVLIADDEAIIRSGLKEKIDWHELGFEIVGEAANGVQAFQLTRELEPDIVITDMKMPVWDGIQLLKAYRENGISVKVIVISAYSSFQYTQSAIKHGAFDYILKPLDRYELEQTLLRAKEELTRSTFEGTASTARDLLSNARDQFLASFVESDLNFAEMFAPADKQLSAVCAAAYIPLLPEYAESVNGQAVSFLKEIRANLEASMCFSHLAQYNSVLAPSQKNKYVLYIILRCEELEKPDITPTFEKVRLVLNNMFRCCVSLGISHVFFRVSDINNAISQAMNALSYRPVLDADGVISCDSIPQMYVETLSTNEAEHTFLAALETGSYEEVERNIQRLFAQIRSIGSVPFRQVYKLLTELLFLCERILRKYQISMDDIFANDITMIDYIAARGNLDDLEEWFLETINQILDLISSKKQNNITATVADIQRYIDNHYWEEISLTVLSQRYHINMSYLSEIFKRHTGTTYVEYLSSVRLDHAAKLLSENRKLRIHEVAGHVGYADANYFSKCFKKRFGVTPDQYRVRYRY